MSNRFPLLTIFGKPPAPETFLTKGLSRSQEPPWDVVLGRDRSGLERLENITKHLIPGMKSLRKRYCYDDPTGPRILRSEYVVPRRDGTFDLLPHIESVIKFRPKKDFDLKKLARTLREGGFDPEFIKALCKQYERERFAAEYLREEGKVKGKFGNKIFWLKWFDLLFSCCRGGSLLFLMAGGNPRKIESIKRQKEFAGKDWSAATISNYGAATLTHYVAGKVFGKSPYTEDTLVVRMVPKYRADNMMTRPPKAPSRMR
jgi:hypothetical protein